MSDIRDFNLSFHICQKVVLSNHLRVYNILIIFYFVTKKIQKYNRKNKLLTISVYIHFFFFLFKASPAAYGSSWSRGQVGAAAASLHHSQDKTEPKLPL